MFFINTDVRSAERFDLAKFMDFSQGRYDPLDSFFLRELPKLHSRGKYTIQTDEQRPDNISFHIYGTTEYWWIVMWFNGILSIEELTAQTVLEIPSEDDVSQLFFRLGPLARNAGR